MEFETKHIHMLEEAVRNAHEALADMVTEMLTEYFKKTGRTDPNYPILLSERVVNAFVLNLMKRVYTCNGSYAFETMLRHELKAKLEEEKQKMNQQVNSNMGG